MTVLRRGALCLVFQCFAAAVHGQAWVPARGEGSVSVTYQNYYATGHFDVRGNKNKNGATHAKTLVTEVDYGITDTLGLTISLPFIASKYTGPPVYFVGGHATFPGPLDDRTYHTAFQDVRVEIRRAFWAGPLAVTPFIGGSVPSHEYETHGEAVAGRHRRELLLGASAGADLDRLLRRTYGHVRYSLASAERDNGFPSLKSNIDVETGHALTSRVTLRGQAAWQIRHKGPTVEAMAHHDWLGHDRFVVSSFFNLGGGTSVAMTRSTELYVLWIATVSGNGGAHVGRMFAVGTTWSFGGGWTGFGSVANAQRSNGAPGIRNGRSRSTPQAVESGK